MEIKVYENNKIAAHPTTDYQTISDTVYPLFWIVGHHKSGKSNLARNLMDIMIGPSSKVLIFSTTHDKDELYLDLKQDLQLKHIKFFCFNSIIDEQGENRVQQFNEKLAERIIEDDYQDLKTELSARVYPDYVIIFDDLGQQTRNKHVTNLLRWSRHNHCAVLISCHDAICIDPSAYHEMDLICLFGGLKKERVKKITEESAFPSDFDIVWKEYQDKTKDKYHFATLDKQKGKIWRDLEVNKE